MTDSYIYNSQLPVVAVLFETEFDSMVELYRGVQSYAGTHGAWRAIPLSLGEESLLAELVEHGNLVGLIGGLVSDRWIRAHWTGRMPLVNIENLSSISAVPSVVVDDFEVGNLVASRFLKAGFSHFAFAGLTGNLSSELKLQGFKNELPGIAESLTCAPRGWIAQSTQGWGNWLKELPKPVAVFCASDFVARRLILACRSLGINVPESVSIVGVGNVYRDSLFSGIPIASVELPYFDLGFAAGRVLDKFRQGLLKPPYIERFNPVRLLERASCRFDSMKDILISKAMERMRDRRHQIFSIRDLAQELGVSRRLLEQRFRAAIGSSPYAELLKMRMRLAEELLTNTSRKILEISQQCGFSSQHQFSNSFKREHGISPRAYRDRTG